MAQDVTIAGASYEDVPGIEVPKTGGGTSSFFDVSDTTATAADVAQGKTFHLASGAAAVGTASGGSGVSVFYGTCATAAATAAKVVVCEEFTSADLVAGTVVNVKFTNAQTYNGAPTLNVQSTGAKNIKRVDTTNAARYEWLAGEVLQFVYDGTYWMLTDGGIATTTYYGVTKLSSATNSTSTSLAATASAVKAAYDHADGKQDKLVSGTNIKTVNSTSLLGSGNVEVQPTLVSGTNIKTINGNSILGSGDLAVGGGGGGSELILYTDGSFTNLWIDAAKTTTLFESFEYDYHVAKAEMSKFSAIKIWNNSLDIVYFVSRWKVDTIDETFEVYFSVDVSVVISTKTYRLLQVQKISPS